MKLQRTHHEASRCSPGAQTSLPKGPQSSRTAPDSLSKAPPGTRTAPGGLLTLALACALVVMAACGVAPRPDEASDGGDGAGAVADAGPSDSGVTAQCALGCDPALVCEAGTCLPRNLALRWLSPGNGARTEVGPTLLRLQLVPFPGRAQSDPSTLEAVLEAPDGGRSSVTLADDAGYAARIDVTTGRWTATAQWGVLSATQTFEVGPAPPRFRLELAPAPDAGLSNATLQLDDPIQPGSRRRDAIVGLRVSVESGEATPGSLGVTLRSGADRVALSTGPCPPSLPCTGPTCACFAADLSVPRFDQFRGQLDLEVSGRAADGTEVIESSTTVPQRIPTIPVSRWAWRRRFFTPMGSSFVGGPFLAIDDRGRTIVAEQQDARATTASITATGRVQWQGDVWSMASPLVAQWPDAGEVVHLPQFWTGVATLETDGGALVAEPPLQSTLDLTAVAWDLTLAPASSVDGGTWDVVMGMYYPDEPSNHAPFAWGPGLWVRGPAVSSGELHSVTGNGASLAWSHSTGVAGGTSFVTQVPLVGSSFPSLALQQVYPNRGARQLVPVDDGYVASSYFSQGPSWFHWTPGTNALDWTWPTTSAFGARGFVMPTPTELIGARYVAASGAMELVRIGVGSLTPAASANLGAPSLSAPALGADGLVYVVDTAGGLSARPSSTLTSSWDTVFLNERFEGAPLLD